MKVNSVGAKIEALQQQGVQVMFYHFRRVSDASKDGPWNLKRHFRNGKRDRDERPAHISPVGGATCCLLVSPEGEKYYGIVVFERSVTRHPLAFHPYPHQLETKPRQFCYAVGRAVALGRAMQKMVCGEPEQVFLGDTTALLMRVIEPKKLGQELVSVVMEA